MESTSPLVFLSYAHEDAGAARRISDALRAFGIEVWHDQSDERGGDAWDEEIKKQIRECALFIPVISENTQKRIEGDFRREWTLAAERTHDMAAGTPYLLPVVVDATVQAGAVVPEEFQKVQWARLDKGVPRPEFVQQVQRQLGTSVTPPEPTVVEKLAEKVGRSHKEVWALVLVTTILVGGVGFFKTLYHHAPGTAGLPVVLLMDSVNPDQVYDSARLKAGGTNADDLTDLLHDLPVTLVREPTNAAWRREADVVKKNPALIVINGLAFRPAGPEEEISPLADDKLVGFLGYVATANPETRFIVYARRAWDDKGAASKWRAEAVNRFPVLIGRIDTWRVPLDRATFRNPLTGQELKASVERALGFRSGPASQD